MWYSFTKRLYWLLQRILLHGCNMGQRNGSISCVDEQTTELVFSDSLQESDVVLPRGKQAVSFVTLQLPLIKCISWPLFLPQLPQSLQPFYMIDTIPPSNHINTHLNPIRLSQSWIQHIPPECHNTHITLQWVKTQNSILWVTLTMGTWTLTPTTNEIFIVLIYIQPFWQKSVS